MQIVYHTVNGIVSTILYLRQSSEEKWHMELLSQDIANILSMLCKRKGVNIVEAEICPDHVHMLVEIPPNISVDWQSLSDVNTQHL